MSDRLLLLFFSLKVSSVLLDYIVWTKEDLVRFLYVDAYMKPRKAEFTGNEWHLYRQHEKNSSMSTWFPETPWLRSLLGNLWKCSSKYVFTLTPRRVPRILFESAIPDKHLKTKIYIESNVKTRIRYTSLALESENHYRFPAENVNSLYQLSARKRISL